MSSEYYGNNWNQIPGYTISEHRKYGSPQRWRSAQASQNQSNNINTAIDQAVTDAFGNPNTVGNPTGTIRNPGSDIEDAWIPGAVEATQIFNQGLPELDPEGYLDTSMQNLIALQNPSQNPYLQDMLRAGQSSIADQTLSSLGMSGRGAGSIDPVTGEASDSAINLIDNLGNYTNEFLGNQYQQDMNRALSASLGGGDFIRGTLGQIQNQPWQNLNNYTNVVSNLTGSSPNRPQDPGTSGWDRLMGIGALGLGFAGL